MEFEQKAEEKKMSMSKNIARLAVTAGLTAALSFGGVMAPVTMAFAAEGAVTTTNSITIKKNNDNGSVKYKAYQIFEADVVDESGKTGKTDKVVSNVKWATGVNDATQKAIIKAINDYNENNADDLKTDASPQDVANWLTANITGTTNTTVLKDTDLLSTLAGLVAKDVAPTISTGATEASFAAGNKVSFDKSGYYLFLTDKDTLAPDGSEADNKNTATSPIYAVVGAGDVVVTEKTSIPTVNKAVMDDKDKNWVTVENGDILTKPNKAADSAMDDWVDYKLVGTVASNIDTYSDYKYVFTDKLPNSMTPKFVDGSENNVPDVTVTIGNQTVKNDAVRGYTTNLSDDNELTVNFKNLRNCVDVDDNPIAVNASSRVTVEYQAKLDSSKIFDSNNVIKEKFKDLIGKAQENTVKLTYSNNPNGTGEGNTVIHPAYDYTYGIDVTKVGSDNETKGLEGVEFTLQEQGDTNSFIKANGTKTTNSEQAKLRTDAKGKINVVGLDEGTYILKEVTPAPGYNNSAANGVTFTIKRELNQTGDEVIPSVDSAIKAADGVVKDNKATASTGKLSFIIVDQKGSNLPLTGLNGVTFTWIAGGAVLCIGVAHLIRSRKQAEESEQE